MVSKRYIQFSKAKFEYELVRIKQSCEMQGWHCVTALVEYDMGMTSWEYIYAFPTRNINVKIVIYSSVDMRTGKVRDKGNDAVRVVYRITNSKGEVYYKHIKKHLRIDTLFNNLETTIWNADCDCFNIKMDDNDCLRYK